MFRQMRIFPAKNSWKNFPEKQSGRTAFTLPEVIISFSVMAMVITSAVSVLTVVLRTNSDNMNSLIANGLAQEGVEAVRFVRDSDVLLGLDFDGAAKNSVVNVWGAKLFDKMSGAPTFLKVVNNPEVQTECNKVDLPRCLPVTLQQLPQESLETLAVSQETLVREGFHRVIRVEPLRILPGATEPDGLRINSIVYWSGINGQSRKVVLTTELTDWK